MQALSTNSFTIFKICDNRFVANFAKYLTRSIYRCLIYPLEQACDATQKADVAAVVMQEGLANLVLVTPAMTLLRAKVEVTIPRKRRGSCTQHEKVGQLFM